MRRKTVTRTPGGKASGWSHCPHPLLGAPGRSGETPAEGGTPASWRQKPAARVPRPAPTGTAAASKGACRRWPAGTSTMRLRRRGWSVGKGSQPPPARTKAPPAAGSWSRDCQHPHRRHPHRSPSSSPPGLAPLPPSKWKEVEDVTRSPQMRIRGWAKPVSFRGSSGPCSSRGSTNSPWGCLAARRPWRGSRKGLSLPGSGSSIPTATSGTIPPLWPIQNYLACPFPCHVHLRPFCTEHTPRHNFPYSFPTQRSWRAHLRFAPVKQSAGLIYLQA